MNLPDARILTRAQHSRLDKLAAKEPDAKVVGWESDGPVVRYGDTLRRVNLMGRLSKVSISLRRELVA